MKIVTDPQPLNAPKKRDRRRLPVLDYLKPQQSRMKHMTKVDFQIEFRKLNLDADSSLLTMIRNPEGVTDGRN